MNNDKEETRKEKKEPKPERCSVANTEEDEKYDVESL